ncbi:MAG TPA: gephyrin-like molybdotransferase Glp [Anaerolineales bacterium]
MPEFLTLLPPDEARQLLLSQLPAPLGTSERVEVLAALGRVAAEDIHAPHALPEFNRSSVDGYAVRAADTYGASEGMPAYVVLVGEIRMGEAAAVTLRQGECALIHTGAMIPATADAVVMLEHTQMTGRPASAIQEVEVSRPVAPGENVIRTGEDVAEGQVVIEKGRLIRPAEIGGLVALGNMDLRVAKKVKVGIISSGDEVIAPRLQPRPGQVRDANGYSLAALVGRFGGAASHFGIAPDDLGALQALARDAHSNTDVVVITAGSSAGSRDMTADVINSLGKPGVLVHGINTRPGKPTILGVCEGKAVIGLPGNPVSALVNGYLFVVPIIERLLGMLPHPRPVTTARLAVNLASQAGREDWWPVRLRMEQDGYRADPIFGKSNLIFTLAAADGLLRIPPDATGLSAGDLVEVFLI